MRVFFELNGQPRVIRVPNRAVKAKTAAKPKAADGNPGHVGAPMPGSIASVAVTLGQKVNAGDLLLTIEAMKMETGLHADRAATVKAVHVIPGGADRRERPADRAGGLTTGPRRFSRAGPDFLLQRRRGVYRSAAPKDAGVAQG